MEPEGRASALPLSRAEHAIGFFRSIMTGRWQDYVYNLAAAVRALAPEAYDSHLFALEVRLSHILPLENQFAASASYWALGE